MADAVFEDPRLARLYDPLDPDRRDLDAYVAVAAELRARSVLDVGCGTGSLACRLARRGIEVIGVDPPARASTWRAPSPERTVSGSSTATRRRFRPCVSTWH